MRMDICFDLSLTVFVAMFSTLNKTCDSVYMKSNHTKHLMCDSFDCNLNHTLSTDKAQAVHKITKPSSALTLTGPLTTNDRLSIEVAMLNHTQTRPKFQYLFLAVHRSDLNAKPHRESVTAHSEQDARRSLAGQFVLSFAGRLPEVSHVA
ncbi:host cell division inhibitor Icd-like protein [Yersinia enterocolitica]